jgi:ankyrin repeat protein
MEGRIKDLFVNATQCLGRGSTLSIITLAASNDGHEAVVRLLFEKWADVNAQGGYYDNALYAASNEGHEAVVRLLLEKGADVNAQGGGYDNALQAASIRGHEAVVRLLLQFTRTTFTSSC